MTPTATFIFGALTGASVMLIVMTVMLSSIQRDVRRIIRLREVERDIINGIKSERTHEH